MKKDSPVSKLPMERVLRLKFQALQTIRQQKSGSSGRALACTEILEALFFGDAQPEPVFHYDPKLPQKEDRDIVVMGDPAFLPSYFATLAMAGYAIPQPFPAKMSRKIPGVEAAVEGLGEALPIAVGMAFALKQQRSSRRIYCVISHRELEMGVTWEAIHFAGQNRLENLVMVLCEFSKQELSIMEKMEAFQWRMIRTMAPCDHDELVYAFMKSRLSQRKPTCVWVHSISGAGLSLLEHKEYYLDAVLSDEEMQAVEKEIQTSLESFL